MQFVVGGGVFLSSFPFVVLLTLFRSRLKPGSSVRMIQVCLCVSSVWFSAAGVSLVAEVLLQAGKSGKTSSNFSRTALISDNAPVEDCLLGEFVFFDATESV